jgi:hypothetical protein
MDQWVYHLDQPTNRPIKPTPHHRLCACHSPRVRTLPSLRCVALTPCWPMRLVQATPQSSWCVPIEPTDPACPQAHATQPFSKFHSVIWLYHQPFFGFGQLFCYIVSHFAIVNSVILLQLTQSFFLQCSVILWFCQLFCYSELSHFSHSAQISHFPIVLNYFVILSAILAIVLSHVLITTLLSHSCYNAQPF